MTKKLSLKRNFNEVIFTCFLIEFCKILFFLRMKSAIKKIIFFTSN
jgi:hypothetical protein